MVVCPETRSYALRRVLSGSIPPVRTAGRSKCIPQTGQKCASNLRGGACPFAARSVDDIRSSLRNSLARQLIAKQPLIGNCLNQEVRHNPQRHNFSIQRASSIQCLRHECPIPPDPVHDESTTHFLHSKDHRHTRPCIELGETWTTNRDNTKGRRFGENSVSVQSDRQPAPHQKGTGY